LIVADCQQINLTVLAATSNTVTFERGDLVTIGYNFLTASNGVVIQILGAPTTISPTLFEYPAASMPVLPVGNIILFHDCLVGDTLPQICQFYKAGVELTEENFTYRGDLSASSQTVRGYWQGAGLPNGNYPAYLRSDTNAPGTIDGWIRGSIRIIPTERSRLKYAPFGNKIKGLWTNDRLVDPTVASQTYLGTYELPGGL
jgi:hypothetical protein